MDMCYDGTLVMPSSYAVMSDEDMTYVEGGGVRRSTAAWLIDIGLCCTPLAAAFAPLKYIGKTAGKALIKKYAGTIAGYLGKAISFLGGMAGSLAINGTTSKVLGCIDDILGSCTSIGGLISIVIDSCDSQGLNGWCGKKWFFF